MKNIFEEYLKIESEFRKLPGLNDHRNRKYKDPREWWILGRLKLIFNKEKLNSFFPDYANKLPENDTDFEISFDGKIVYKYIQIIELPPIEISRIGIENRESIRDLYVNVVNQKFLSDFGVNNWLIVYFDIPYHYISEYGYWHNSILEISKKLIFIIISLRE
jgi:hypothetical protein